MPGVRFCWHSDAIDPAPQTAVVNAGGPWSGRARPIKRRAVAGSPLNYFRRGLSPPVTAPTTATATATAVSAWSAVAAATSALAAPITTRFATVLTATVAIGLRLFPAFARLALLTAFVRRAAFAGWGTLSGCAAGCRVAVGHSGPAGEPHAALFIHTEALDPDLIAHLDDVLDHLDAEVGQLTDVNQAVLAGQELDKCAELLDGDHSATIDLIDLGLGGHARDGIHRDLHPVCGDGVDVHRAVVINIDLATGFLDELLDVLAARADEQADLLGVDLHRLDARGILADFRPRGGQGLGHLGQHVQSRDARLFHRLGHQTERDAAQLEVELEAGDAFLGAGDLAVHVAERVFPADDVGEQLILRDLVLGIVLGAQTDADAAHRAGHGHARVQHRQAAAANGGHRGGAVRLHDLAGDADGVRIGRARNHRFERTLSQCAVANLPPARTADAPGFADREVRKVIVQDELLLGGAAGVGVELLGVFAGAEGAEREGLRLPALE